VQEGVNALGYKLKECREKKHMSQEELSEKSGISRQTISAIENNSEKCVTSRTLKKLAQALDMTIGDLFFGNSD
jgi:transcriptional regulator with XRE-family HTH domain